MTFRMQNALVVSLLLFSSASCLSQVATGDTERVQGKVSKIPSEVVVLSIQHDAVSSGAWIKGEVQDRDTGDPIAGASIALVQTKLEASSDIAGAFVMTNVPTGSYRLTARWIGHTPANLDSLRVDDHDLITLEIRMSGDEADSWTGQ